MVSLVNFRRNNQQRPDILNDVRPTSGLPVKCRVGCLSIPFLIALILMTSPAAQADDLQDYAALCDQAIGATATVNDFDCDAGTEVPVTHPTTSGTCDEPNRLSGVCDPGSHFTVLTRTADAFVVAHCRKKGNGPSVYGDIAVIQYNRKNGATCFYQALGTLPGHVKAPSNILALDRTVRHCRYRLRWLPRQWAVDTLAILKSGHWAERPPGLGRFQL
jgi:hypothetical protein